MICLALNSTSDSVFNPMSGSDQKEIIYRVVDRMATDNSKNTETA